MKICFNCDEYPPVSHGGIGTVVKSLAEEMVDKGHEVFVVGILPRSFGGRSYEEINGVKIWRIKHGIKIPYLSRQSLLYKIINKIFDVDFWGLKKAWIDQNVLIENLVDQHGIEIIEFPDYRLAFSKKNLPKFLWPEINIPKVVKFHGSINYFNLELDKPVDKHIYRYERGLYDYADTLISVSDYTRIRMEGYYQFDKKIDVIYNGLELQEVRRSTETDEVIFSGSLLDKKGIIPLLKAWNEVCEMNKSVTLIIYGKGVKQRYLRYIKPSNVARVKFMGHTDKSTLLEKYVEAKMAVFPSFAEAFALAPMEAMMMGCPTIYSNTTSGDELAIEPNSLVLIDPHSPMQISTAILDLLDDKEKRQQMSLNGRELIRKHFAIEKIAKNHLDYYKSIISKI